MGSSGQSESVTILFADNDPEFLKTRSEYLEKNGYRVISTGSPDKAKQIIDQKQIGLAILDMRLINDDDEKDTTGLNIARESDPEIPKIILTRFPTVEAVRQALKSRLDTLPPAVDFVSKQEGPQALLAAIERVSLNDS